MAEAHRRYTRHINFREKWKGHLWQECFASYPMNESHLLAAARYMELNPVRASLAKEPWSYSWSSAAAHVRGCDDTLVHVLPLLEIVEDWRGFIGWDIHLLFPQGIERRQKDNRRDLRIHKAFG